MRANSRSKCALCGGAAVLALAAVSSTASAAVIVRESFTHPDGNLAGQIPEIGGAWATHSGTAGQMQVSGGQAAVVQTQGEDVNTSFNGGAIGTGSVIYAGFDLTVPAQANVPATGYFAHFKDAGNFFGSRVFITAPVTSGFRLGISGNATLLASETNAADLAFDTVYRVVTMYNYDTGATQMWIDQTDESGASVVATDGFAGDEFLSFALREFATVAGGTSTQRVDNLWVATTFGEAAVPEPTASVLLTLAASGLLARRRRVRS